MILSIAAFSMMQRKFYMKITENVWGMDMLVVTLTCILNFDSPARLSLETNNQEI